MTHDPAAAGLGSDRAPASRRGRSWVVIVVGGAVGTAGALAAILLVLGFAFSGQTTWGLAALLSLVAGVVAGGLLAALGFRGLGVRRGWRTATLGALVAGIGTLGPWVTAAVLART